MNTLKHLSWSKAEDLKIITSLLTDNEIIVGSSDTVLGLLGNTTAGASASLDRIKKRSKKAYIVLISDKEKLDCFIAQPLPEAMQKLVNHCWPGPLTLILKAHESIPCYLKSDKGSIALRIPRHEGLLQVLKNFKGLFSTSANKSGQPVAHIPSELDPSILQESACLVLDENEKSTTIIPSTILDCTGQEIHVIREGAYSIRQLEQISGIKFCTLPE
ncbi:L-threonylcarbamoyladenylate synthase [Candidatus Dependentiae bacterium]|nr:L-threonylcarbamoyladenylate synthase [Candidatus Dependentiae bacterium]